MLSPAALPGPPLAEVHLGSQGREQGGPLMTRIKRWTHGVVASIDNLIVQVENHEAVVSSTLRELEQGVARSKLQLMRVERDGQALEQALDEEREAVVRWRDRAAREAQEER